MKYKLSGFINPLKSGEKYIVMFVNEYDSLVNILNNFSDVTNTPLRKNRSAHIWMGPRMLKIIKNTKDMEDMGVFSVECKIEKNSSGQLNITTIGLPEIDY